MDDSQLTMLADASFVESLREFARWGEGGELVEQPGMLLVLASDDFPGINVACRTGEADAPSAEDFLARARAYFAQHGRAAFSIRARGERDADLGALCRARSFHPLFANPGMVIDRAIPEHAARTSCELRVVCDLATAEDFTRVCIASYAPIGFPEASASRMLHRKQRLLAPHLHAVVAYDGGEPVSAALALLSHGVGGVYWVGTVPSARRRAIAPACTRVATNWAFEQGARRVFLQASKQGLPIYQTLGYREHTSYPWFIASSHGAE